MNRLAAMQLWPAFCTRASTPTLAAFSRSALGITMNGSDPPSSSTTFLMLRPAASPMLRPAPSLPVSVAAAMRGSSSSLLARLPSMSKVWKAPSGNPAARKTSSMASAHCGTLEACFSTAAFPATSPGAAKRKTCQSGKFHGITASTTPSG